jgi:hypothetical protein
VCKWQNNKTRRIRATTSKTHISKHMFQNTYFKTHVSKHIFQNTYFKTHISKHIFQNTCFKTHISKHIFQNTYFTSKIRKNLQQNFRKVYGDVVKLIYGLYSLWNVNMAKSWKSQPYASQSNVAEMSLMLHDTHDVTLWRHVKQALLRINRVENRKTRQLSVTFSHA